MGRFLKPKLTLEQKKTMTDTLTLSRKPTLTPTVGSTKVVETTVASTPALPPQTVFRELVPYIACLVSPEEFPAALKSNYSQIYITAEDGYYKHMKLAGGRHVRIKVDSLPLVKGQAKPMAIKEELNFLPAGKIPNEFFEQIVLFFREVMRLKKADYEAHAWILWEKEKGYYISIPKQTVSKAAVSFSYDNEALPPGAVIVCDLHSH